MGKLTMLKKAALAAISTLFGILTFFLPVVVWSQDKPEAASSVAQAEFAGKNKTGLESNPAGVDLVLRTADGRSEFHLYENIPIELNFSSKRRLAYSIELDESMNFAGQANQFEVFPADTVLLPSAVTTFGGIMCCETNRRYLSSRPTTLKRELTDEFRFEKPGTYSVYFWTRRVFKGMGKRDDFDPSRLILTSNMLTLTILPDDAEWDARQLASVLEKLHDPQLKAKRDAMVKKAWATGSELGASFAFSNLAPQTEFEQARKALNALDTDQAIRERVKLMEMESKAQLDLSRQDGSFTTLLQPLLRSTARPDVVVACLKERAERPDFGVDSSYFDLWTRFVIERDHPELFRPANRELAKDRRQIDQYKAYFDETQRKIVAMLETMLPAKRGEAADNTALTIKIAKSFLSHEASGRRAK
jgi:hypothetical protein